MLYFCERIRRQMRCTLSGGWSVGGERRQSPGNHRWGRSYVFAASHLMYLWLFLLWICDFSSYVFAGSPVMYLWHLLICIFNLTCYVFCGFFLMYFQLHLLCICDFSSYVFSTSSVMYLHFPWLLCDNFSSNDFRQSLSGFKSFSILHPTYDNMYWLKTTSILATLL